ncbi:MAG: hypothetical protein A2W99_01925 [Bacteroidetes bacterium GWF2_33_16]|nr:MAG: hypothetical protein A2X00_16230 [Bacteroidetes bacterium GWE2_32_14]OFY07027.1 MAG: hypothetical protein A2W99_01925 [Bacteroidetes bacterium GWF2_33_16]
MKLLGCFILISLFVFIESSSSLSRINSEHIIFIVKYRWHSGIIINREEAIPFLPSLQNHFINNQYIEIGWGDKDYYMAENETVWLALKAVIIPTKSVLHIHGFNENPEWYFRDYEIAKLSLSTINFNNLLNHINSSFALDLESNPIILGDGLIPNSSFFLSNEKYYLFKTCNAWTAQQLKVAHVDINPWLAITSKNLMHQLESDN